ncbi:hypothetical protein [Halomonas nitroreducens]|uniref:Uncharacterized protein n=1 Tax=Halomonas nitroreducens TaxID=447425 RepID=A0A3S0I4U0_9GAMM|nr:hypothetical protein [Halomonas nitroreducens]RTQ97667.1 hypothetical protein EKG36_19860 [Halomonas nitroreducens]
MQNPASERYISGEELNGIDHEAFDVIGVIPRNQRDPRHGLYIVLKEKPPFATRLLIEVDDPDNKSILALLRRHLKL